MPISRRASPLHLASALASLTLASVATAQTISYPDFSSTAGLQLNGSAFQNGAKLTLVPSLFTRNGSAFSTTTVALDPSAAFSTYFTFEILNRRGLGNGADGLTFTVQTVASTVGSTGGGLGYAGIPNSAAVEFDTYNNGEPGGSNHVGIDVGGSVTSVVSTPQLTPDFDDGGVWHAWVDYDGASDALEVRWARSDVRPVGSMLSRVLDLPSILGSSHVFVGFTAATGAGAGEHNIRSWSFVNRFVPGGAPAPGVVVTPEPRTWTLLAAGLLGVLAVARRRRSGVSDR